MYSLPIAHMPSTWPSLPIVDLLPHAVLVLSVKLCPELQLESPDGSGKLVRAKECCFCEENKYLGAGTNDNSLVQHMGSKRCRQAQCSLGNPLPGQSPNNSESVVLSANSPMLHKSIQPEIVSQSQIDLAPLPHSDQACNFDGPLSGTAQYSAPINEATHLATPGVSVAYR